MKKSSKRALSRLLAGIMLVSSMFTNVYANDVTGSVSTYDAVVSGSGADATLSGGGVEVSGPEYSKTYEYDFLTDAWKATDFSSAVSTEDGLVTINAQKHNGAHGIQFGGNTSISIMVAGDAEITFASCQYTNGLATVTDANGTVLADGMAMTNGLASCWKNTKEDVVTYSYKGDATTLTFTFSGAVYLPYLKVENGDAPEIIDVATEANIVVWDFGGQVVSDTAAFKYTNSISEAKLESMGTSVAKKTITDWGNGLTYNGDARFYNQTASSYDASNAEREPVNITDGYDTFNGYMYINGTTGANATTGNQHSNDRYFTIDLKKGDKISWSFSPVNSNATTGTAHFMYVGEYGEQHSTQFVEDIIYTTMATSPAHRVEFVAECDGTYEFWTDNAKIAYERIVYTPKTFFEVSGNLTAPVGIPADFKVAFINDLSGEVRYADVTSTGEGTYTYTAALPCNFNYTLEVQDANGYVIETPNPATVVVDEPKTMDIAIVQIPLNTISGTITGLDEEALSRMSINITPAEERIFVPMQTIEGTNYSFVVEPNVEYTVSFNDINDYEIVSGDKINIAADVADNTIALQLKPKYTVTPVITGLTADQLAKLNITYTNLNETYSTGDGSASYAYTFAATDAISLRDGSYDVTLSGLESEQLAPAMLADVVIDGAAVTQNIDFAAVQAWNVYDDFVQADADAGYFQGIKLNGVTKNYKGGNTGYLLGKSGNSIEIPVKAGQGVVIDFCYQADFNFDGEQAVVSATKKTQMYNAAGAIAKADGYMTINFNNTTYVTGIRVIDNVVDFAETITVGADKQYQTINDALDAVYAMNRPNDERVTIMVDPGNYEEMVAVGENNITLKNAAGENASIELTNKGVDIAENAVRITSYYGCGYNYYSQNGVYHWDANKLAENKANGYAAIANKGGGSATLWNATFAVNGTGFEADGIIFENSFNQYTSAKEAEDIIVATDAAIDPTKDIKAETDEATTARNTYAAGDVTVQNKAFVERAAALAVMADKAVFNNCRVVGRQDSFYGEKNCRVYYKDGIVMGGTDYLFGGMIAVFDNTKLMINTMQSSLDGTDAITEKNSNDICYITAPQQDSGRGYLMYNCVVTSTTPGVDTASEYRAKANKNYFGRPWSTTSETVFYNTVVETGYSADDTASGAAMWGDVDMDGIITANDASAAYQFVLNRNFDNNHLYDGMVADVDGVTGIQASDAAWILQKALISTTEFPVAGNELPTDGTQSLITGAGWLDSLGGKAPVYEYGTIEIGTNDGTPRADWSTVLSEPTLPDGTEITIANWLAGADAWQPQGEEPKEELAATTIYVVGDSTGCDYAPTTDKTYYYKRVGFGTRLGEYFAPEATVVNYALSGRSSKSFLTEANYTSLISNMKSGDYLIIAFGHNDEKSDDAARYTEPLGDKDTAGSFKNSLYVNYIQPALNAGATPILCTPTVRRSENGSWSNNQLHVANGKSYSDCVRELGAELGLTVIDNTQLTKDLYDSLTPSGTVDLHAWLSSKSTSVDNTHLNNYGAAYVAYMMADAIKKSDNTLSAYVGDIAAPDKATNLIVNPEYTEPSVDDVTGDALISQYWKTTSPWYGTAFGDIGGQSKLNETDAEGNNLPTLTVNATSGKTNFAIDELADGSVQIRTGDVATTQSFGKIAGTTDAFTLYYMPVDAASNFEISATATVNDVLIHSQTSFGAICMDRILVDTNAKETYDYVAAGAVKYGATDATTGEGTTYLTFTRDASTSTLATNVQGAYTPAAGDVVNVKITKVGDKFTATYGDTTTTYEKPMTGTVYFGFYTTRNADVTFSNIVYNNEVTE